MAVNFLVGELAEAAFYRIDKGCWGCDGIRSRQSNSQIKYRIGKPVEPMEKTYEMALNPELYAYEVAKKYGINLRGSRRCISFR